MSAQRVMGLIERVSGSGVWWIRYTDAEGKRHLEKAGRRGDAINLLAKRQHEKLIRKKLPECLRGKTVTFGELAEFAKLYSKESHTPRHHHQFVTKLDLIGQSFNDLLLEGITEQEIQAWLLKMSEEREWTPATRNRYRDAFSLVFRKAVENHRIASNPTSLVKAKTEHSDRIRFLSPEDEIKLVIVLRENWPQHIPAFLVSLHTGMRAGEQFDLKWADVSFEQRSIALSKTKTGKSRHIPLNAIAFHAFQEVKAAKRDPRFVFHYEGRSPVHNYRRWFDAALKLAGIDNYSWHCNRHTFASRLVMAGVDIRTVAELMGHSTIQMTMRYAHLAPQHNRAAVDRLVSAYSAVVAKTASGENHVVTKSVTNTKSNSRSKPPDKSFNINTL